MAEGRADRRALTAVPALAVLRQGKENLLNPFSYRNVALYHDLALWLHFLFFIPAARLCRFSSEKNFFGKFFC